MRASAVLHVRWSGATTFAVSIEKDEDVRERGKAKRVGDGARRQGRVFFLAGLKQGQPPASASSTLPYCSFGGLGEHCLKTSVDSVEEQQLSGRNLEWGIGTTISLQGEDTKHLRRY
jgi:hypothetical protein